MIEETPTPGIIHKIFQTILGYNNLRKPFKVLACMYELRTTKSTLHNERDHNQTSIQSKSSASWFLLKNTILGENSLKIWQASATRCCGHWCKRGSSRSFGQNSDEIGYDLSPTNAPIPSSAASHGRLVWRGVEGTAPIAVLWSEREDLGHCAHSFFGSEFRLFDSSSKP